MPNNTPDTQPLGDRATNTAHTAADRMRQTGDTAANTAHTAADRMRQTGDAAASTVENVADRARDLGNRAASTVENVTDKAQQLADTAQQRASDLAATASDKADSAMTATGSQLQTLAQTVREKAPTGAVGQYANQAADALDRSGQYLQQADINMVRTDVEKIIRQHPIESLLVGLGVGYLLARATRR